MAQKMQSYDETRLLKRSPLSNTGIPTAYHRNPKIMCCVLLTSNAINETKNTSANEWRFDEGSEKSPSVVILVFLTGTSSLRNKIHALQL